MTTKLTDKNISNVANLGLQWQSVITADGSTATTAVAGRGYLIDTTSNAHTINLPASAIAGDTIAIKDYAGTFGTNNLTISRNGSNIQGVANDSQISTNRASVELIYVDSTKGWVYTNESNVADLEKKLYVTATGGTITTSSDYKIHTFTGDGCFVVSCAGNPGGSTAVDYLVVAGGGGGGSGLGGGGGAGGYRTSFPSPGCNAGAFPISATTYPVTVGAGAAPVATNESGTPGSNSVFSTITSTGGGGGGGYTTPGSSGGSGGGGGGIVPAGSPTGGSGNTPPVSPPQGNDGGGGSGPTGSGGGGGGAGATGTTGTPPAGGPGGNGLANSITGSSVTRAGGGGGGTYCTSKTEGSGGSGGGGNGGRANDPQVPTPLTNGDSGTANTGGGGGGTGASGGGAVSGAGGKGIVIIRYKFQN